MIGTLSLIRNTFNANVSRHIGATAGVAGLASLVAVMFATFAHRTYRDPVAGITLSVIATTFGALAGFLAVPGRPGFAQCLAGRDGGSSHVGAGDARIWLWHSHIDCRLVLRATHRYRRIDGCGDRRRHCARSARYPRWYHLACWAQRRGFRSSWQGCPLGWRQPRNWMSSSRPPTIGRPRRFGRTLG